MDGEGKELEAICHQLIGLVDTSNEIEKGIDVRLEYVTGFEMGLTAPHIRGMALSPRNEHLLITGATESEQVSHYVFQLDLFLQLPNADPAMFLKPIRNIYRHKPNQRIVCSLLRNSPFFLTGTQIHSMESEIMDGALSFDIHPLHLYIAVSFGFSTKIYAVEGQDRPISLFAMSTQGLKHLRYSPRGNHLCLLFSKYIKIVNAYSFE